MTKQEWERPLSEQHLHRALGSPKPPGTAHTRAIPLLPGSSRHFPRTGNTTAGSQGRKSNPAAEHGKHNAEEGFTEGRISYQVTSQQLHLVILGNSLLPSLPSVTKHHIQHLGGAVPHCLGTLHYFFFPLAIHFELFYKEQHNINVPSL